MDILIYIALGLLIFVYFLKWKKQVWRCGTIIPGPKGLPLVGIALEIAPERFHEKLSEYAEQYGDIYKLNILGTKVVVLNTADFVRKAFNVEPYKKYMNDKSRTFFGEEFLCGNQSIAFTENAYGSVHSDLRKVFTQALHVYGEGRTEFENLVQRSIAILVDEISSYKENEFDFMHHVKRSLTTLIASLLGGQESDIEEDFRSFWNYNDAGSFILDPQVNIMMQTFPFIRFLPSVYKRQYQRVVAAREDILKKYFHNIKATHKPGQVNGLVHYLLEEQMKAKKNGGDVLFTDSKIICMLLETIPAGMVTTVCTISSLFVCLMNHPEYQTRMQEELDSVIGRDRKPSMSDKSKCPFIEAVLLETLRLLPVLPILCPRFCKQDMNFEGYDVEANSQIIANAWYIHHDEKTWGDPWTFRPERFLDDNGQLLPNDHLYRKCWLPFGTGRRQCVGESFARSRIFLYVATLLQRWTFTMDPKELTSCDPRKGAFSFETACMPKHYKCKVVSR